MNDPSVRGQIGGFFKVVFKTADALESRVIIKDSTPNAEHLSGCGDNYAFGDTWTRAQAFMIPPDLFGCFTHSRPMFDEWPEFDPQEFEYIEKSGKGHDIESLLEFTPKEIAVAMWLDTQNLTRADWRKQLKKEGVKISNVRLSALRDLANDTRSIYDSYLRNRPGFGNNGYIQA